jgi:hypothetical protein
MPTVTPGYTFTGTTDPITYTKLNLLAQPTVAAIGPNDVTTTTIANSAVTADKLASDAVTTVKILNNAVTLAKIVAAASNNTFLARSTTGAGNYEAVDTTTTGLGFYTGAGGTVTQATSKATAFTLNNMCGQITTAADALAAATIVSATWTNSKIAATDVVIINHKSGGTVGSYTFNVSCGAGSATLYIRNATAVSLSEALVLSFVVIKGVTS